MASLSRFKCWYRRTRNRRSKVEFQIRAIGFFRVFPSHHRIDLWIMHMNNLRVSHLCHDLAGCAVYSNERPCWGGLLKAGFHMIADRRLSQRDLFPYNRRRSQTITEPTVAIHFVQRKCHMYSRVVLAGKSKRTSRRKFCCKQIYFFF